MVILVKFTIMAKELMVRMYGIACMEGLFGTLISYFNINDLRLSNNLEAYI